MPPLLLPLLQRWRHWKRETVSFLTVLIPWELRIKEIESHFGSGVASYFTFLRWLMWVNIMIAIPLVAFVIGPEVCTRLPPPLPPVVEYFIFIFFSLCSTLPPSTTNRIRANACPSRSTK